MNANEIVRADISNSLGLPYEDIAKMEIEDVEKIIEAKSGNKLNYQRTIPISRLGSGDDSVAIDRGRIRTMDEVNANLDRAIANTKNSMSESHKDNFCL